MIEWRWNLWTVVTVPGEVLFAVENRRFFWRSLFRISHKLRFVSYGLFSSAKKFYSHTSQQVTVSRL